MSIYDIREKGLFISDLTLILSVILGIMIINTYGNDIIGYFKKNKERYIKINKEGKEVWKIYNTKMLIIFSILLEIAYYMIIDLIWDYFYNPSSNQFYGYMTYNQKVIRDNLVYTVERIYNLINPISFLSVLAILLLVYSFWKTGDEIEDRKKANRIFRFMKILYVIYFCLLIFVSLFSLEIDLWLLFNTDYVTSVNLFNILYSLIYFFCVLIGLLFWYNLPYWKIAEYYLNIPSIQDLRIDLEIYLINKKIKRQNKKLGLDKNVKT